MKKFCWMIVFLFCFFFTGNVSAQEEVHLYLFYGETCPVCEAEREYLETVREQYSNVRIFEFETYQNEENDVNMQVIKEMYQIHNMGVPFTVVGDTAILGFSSANQAKIERAIKKYSEQDYYDRVGVYLGLFEDEEIEDSTSGEESSIETSTEMENTHQKTSMGGKWILFSMLILILIIAGIWLYRGKNRTHNSV